MSEEKSSLDILREVIPKMHRDDLELMLIDVLTQASPYIGDRYEEMAKRTGLYNRRGPKPMIYKSSSINEEDLIVKIEAGKRELVIYDYYNKLITKAFMSDKGYKIGDVRTTKEIYLELYKDEKEFRERRQFTTAKASQKELNGINHILTLAGFKISRKISKFRHKDRVRAWRLRDEFQGSTLEFLILRYENFICKKPPLNNYL